jgi:hypothetical protein
MIYFKFMYKLFIFNALFSELFYKHFIKHQFNIIWLVSWLFNRHKRYYGRNYLMVQLFIRFIYSELIPFWLRVIIMLGPISNHRSKFKGVLPEPEDNQESLSVYLFMRVIIFKFFLYLYRLKKDNWDNFGLNFFILKHSSNSYGTQHYIH